MSFTCERTGSWWMTSKNAESRSTSYSSRASAEARSKRNPSTWHSVTKYRNESMIRRSTEGFTGFSELPVPVKSM